MLSLCHVDAIAVNGPAIREKRMDLRIGVEDLAKEVGISRAYLAKIELGHSKKVSVEVLDKLERALMVRDRRAFLADPHAPANQVAS